MNKKEYINRVPIDKNNICIYRDESLCTQCGACKGVCNLRIGVYGHYDMENSDKPRCINCGQCSLVCPNNSIRIVEDYLKVEEEINSGKTVVVQIAPASRFLIGDEFGYPIGKNVIGKTINALKKLGFKYVFDTTYGADLTVCEEANEFIDRLNNNNNLPMFTSCCPAWVKYQEYFYPELSNNLSSTKSPILMEGAIIKNYFAKKKNINDIVVVAIVPCTAKKYEITKSDDVDYAITVRELCKWIKSRNINFRRLKDMRFDDFTGTASGLIFGTSGGVMEAMLRYTYHLVNKKSPPKRLLNFEEIRGLTDVKKTSIVLKGRKINIAVINGTGDVPSVIDKIRNHEEEFDIIEVMACDGGCIAGGGGPKVNRVTNTIKNNRSNVMYKKDRSLKRRNSYENPKIKNLYKEFLGYPLSDISKKYLHYRSD